MKKKFILNLLFLIVINLLIKPFWFLGIEVGVQNHVSNVEYGLFFTLFNFTLVFNIILDLGITNYNNREIAKHSILLTRMFSHVTVIKIILGLAYLLIGLIIGYSLGYRNFSFYLLIILAFNQIIASFILYLRSYINGMLMFITDSIISVLDRTLMIIICGILLWTNISGGRFQIEWFAIIQTFSYIVTAIVAFIIVANHCHPLRFKADLIYFKLILRKSLPFSLLVILMQLYSRMDSIFIERLLPNGAEQAGIYAYSFRIFDVLTNFAYLFPVLLLPLFSKLLRNKESISPLLELSAILIWVASITASFACYYFSNDIMFTLYKNTISSGVLSILIFAFIGISTTFIFGTLLTANGNLYELNIMSVIGIGINVILNLILIPHLKAKGAAVSCLTTQLFIGIYQVILTYRIIKPTINYRIYLRLCLFIIILTISGYAASQIKPWFIGFGLIFVIGLVCSFALKLLDLRKLYAMIVTYKEQ